MNPLVILYAKCFLALAFGLVIYTGLKFNEVKELHKNANEQLTFKDWLKTTLVSHIINLACVAMWMLLLPDLVKQFPAIQGSVYYANLAHIAGCALVGWGNSSVILKLFGAGTKYVMTVIDKKTNIADGKNE